MRNLLAVELLVPVALLGVLATARADIEPPPWMATGKLCADIATVLAQTDWKGYEPGSTSIARGGNVGWGMTFQLPGASACWLVQPAPTQYPAARSYRCDLGKPMTRKAALQILAQWKTKLTACPAVKALKLDGKDEANVTFDKETNDNHLHSLHLLLEGDAAKPRPAIQIDYSEI